MWSARLRLKSRNICRRSDVANVNSAIIEIRAGDVDDSIAQEVYRNLQVLFGTVTGEQALNREFGIDAAIQDCPAEEARAFLVAEYVRKTQMFEPRARVDRVDWTASDSAGGNMTPKVVIELV